MSCHKLLLRSLSIFIVGGAIVDRYPSPRVIAISIAAAAVYLALIPLTADV